MSEREIILEVLTEILERGEYSHIVLRQTLDKYEYLDKTKRAFISRLVTGVIERKITLDFVIDRFSKTPVRKMKPQIREALRMGVYQILYMDSVPDSAACNESVKLIAKRYRALKGFVNGVLRNVARHRDEVLEAIDGASLSIRCSMPQWLIDRWTADYGEERTVEMVRSFLSPRPTTIRTNLAKITPSRLADRLADEGVTAEPVPEIDYAFCISGYDHLTAIPSFNEGLFYVQDVSSMMVANRADLRQGDHVLDVCAAPGGKSLHFAELLTSMGRMADFLNPAVEAFGVTRDNDSDCDSRPSGYVEARDLTEEKVALIRGNIARSGLENISAKVQDATVDDPASHEAYDVVAADLPCSGLGVIGRKPDIRYRITPEDIRNLAALQQKILGVVCSYVKPGGTLLYSTCTISKRENEDNVAAFLASHPGFTLLSQEQIFPAGGRSDGFFISVMKKSV